MDVVVGCGKAKRPRPCPAASLYTGNFVRAAVAWARSVDARLFILSAKHGLIPGTQVIDPYDVTFSVPHPDIVDTATITTQIATHHLGPEVLMLAGAAYLDHLTQAGPHLAIRRPFFDEARRRFHNAQPGYQVQLLNEWRGDVPGAT